MIIAMNGDDTNQYCAVCACASADRKSPCGHVVGPPCSRQLEVDQSLCDVTNGNNDTGGDDVTDSSARCGI